MRRSSNSPQTAKRRGVVLLAVLVVIVIMALIAYQYSDRMVSNYQAESNAHRSAQLRHIADSGIHYAAQMLTPENMANFLGGNPYDNAERFRDVLVNDFENTGQAGKFTLIAPIDPDQNSSGGSFRPGVTDETGKININAMIKRDPTGELLYAMLAKLMDPRPGRLHRRLCRCRFRSARRGRRRRPLFRHDSPLSLQEWAAR